MYEIYINAADKDHHHHNHHCLYKLTSRYRNHLPTYLPTYPPIYLPTYLPTSISLSFLERLSFFFRLLSFINYITSTVTFHQSSSLNNAYILTFSLFFRLIAVLLIFVSSSANVYMMMIIVMMMRMKIDRYISQLPSVSPA
jgi:hypothetical protein